MHFVFKAKIALAAADMLVVVMVVGLKLVVERKRPNERMPTNLKRNDVTCMAGERDRFG